jgi:hypothetical protein
LLLDHVANGNEEAQTKVRTVANSDRTAHGSIENKAYREPCVGGRTPRGGSPNSDGVSQVERGLVPRQDLNLSQWQAARGELAIDLAAESIPSPSLLVTREHERRDARPDPGTFSRGSQQTTDAGV